MFKIFTLSNLSLFLSNRALIVQNISMLGISLFRRSNFQNNVDFVQCRNDPTLKGSTSALSLSVCETTCGNGIDVWPWDQILGRFVLWLVPTLVLIGNFHYAPLGFFNNTIHVTLHHLSDPIHSIWSMLVMQEVQRRLLRRAKIVCSHPIAIRAGSGDSIFRKLLKRYFHHETYDKRSKCLAAIFAAYDEFGCHSFQALSDVSRLNLNPDQWDIIEEVGFRLTKERTESQTQTWLAVVNYLGAIIGAFIRTYRERENNQTSHTIAVVFLLSYFIALVLLSDNIGVFGSVPDAAAELQQLYGSFATTAYTNHFPNISEPVIVDVAWSGMNSSRRPCKMRIDTVSRRDRHPLPLLACSILVILACYFAAMVLSYYSGTIGFGCRCLAWTSILAAWVISFLLGFIMYWCISDPRVLWIWTTVKDAFFSVYVVGTILAVQIGFLNSCWCRANVLVDGSDKKVNLDPFNDQEWHRNWKVWPSVSVSCLCVMFFFGYLIHVIGWDSEQKLSPGLSKRHTVKVRWPFRLSRGPLCRGSVLVVGEDVDIPLTVIHTPQSA
jgi:hypothetical protein